MPLAVRAVSDWVCAGGEGVYAGTHLGHDKQHCVYIICIEDLN